MQLKNKVSNDRSGISTLLLAIIIIVIFAAAAAVTYVYITNDNDNSNDDGAGDGSGDEPGVNIDDVIRSIAPGTYVEYSVTGGTLTTYKQEYIGQNANEFFIRISKFTGGTTGTASYGMETKGLPSGATKTGSAELDTKYGKRNVEIWEYTQDGVLVKAYIDLLTGLAFKLEKGTEVYIVKDHEIKTQTSYTQSSAIGGKYEYSSTIDGIKYTVTIECVADCTGNQYGVLFKSGSEVYFLSKYSQGLPTDAVDSGDTDILGTIDGNVEVEIWEFSSTSGMKLYFDPISHIIYRIVIPDGSGVDIATNLEKKP